MFDAIKSRYADWKFDRKFAKDLDNLNLDFNINIEIPAEEKLISDLFTVTTKPNVIIFWDKLVQSMIANKDPLSQGFSKNERDLKVMLKKVGLAMIPASDLSMEILSIPDLNVTIFGGSVVLNEIQKEVRDKLIHLGKKQRITLAGDYGSGIILPPETFEKLWDMDTLLLVVAGLGGVQFDYTNHIVCAKLSAATKNDGKIV